LPELLSFFVAHTDIDFLQILSQTDRLSINLHIGLSLLTPAGKVPYLGLMFTADSVSLFEADEEAIEAPLKRGLFFSAFSEDGLECEPDGITVTKIEGSKDIAGILSFPDTHCQPFLAEEGGELGDFFEISDHTW